MPQIETSASQWSTFSLSEDGKVALKEGNHIKWIERINIPDYAKEFYERLEEGADGDGTDDILIDPENSIIEVKLLSSYNPDEVMEYLLTVMNAFDREHPEVFWLSGVSKEPLI